MSDVRIREIGFLNGDTMRDSIGRLGESVLNNGVSPEATAALVRLTCQAHEVPVFGLGHTYQTKHLDELHSLRLVYWTGGDIVKMV